jgi:hypothetical protein
MHSEQSTRVNDLRTPCDQTLSIIIIFADFAQFRDLHMRTRKPSDTLLGSIKYIVFSTCKAKLEQHVIFFEAATHLFLAVAKLWFLLRFMCPRSALFDPLNNNKVLKQRGIDLQRWGYSSALHWFDRSVYISLLGSF